MRAQESSLAAISAKSSHHRPQGLLSMAPRCQMHSWPLYARISTLAHGFNSTHEYSWDHGNILLWVLMRAPEYCWVLIKLSWALWSASKCSWMLMRAPVFSSGCFNNKPKNVNFFIAFPAVFWKYLSVPDMSDIPCRQSTMGPKNFLRLNFSHKWDHNNIFLQNLVINGTPTIFFGKFLS